MSRGVVERRPSVTVILPAYNEEALLRAHVVQIHDFLNTSADVDFDWEILIVNDGSADRTGAIADELALVLTRTRAVHHPVNFGLGQTLKFGFANTTSDYVVTLDADLSYDVRHVVELVAKIRESRAKIVLASPYMPGGEIANVPWARRTLSILGNRFLCTFARGNLSTITSLVRVYDGPFIRSLDLRSIGMDIMPEMLYKSMVLHARIEEIPGRLDWGPQLDHGLARTSSMRVAKHVGSTTVSGFLFRPFLFLVVPGLIVGGFAAYVSYWMFSHFFDALGSGGAEMTFSGAFALAYASHPHTFVIALLSSMLAIQLIGLGAIALQNTRYFEDLYHIGSHRIAELRRPDAGGSDE